MIENNMNKNFYPKNEEEKNLCERIEEMNKSMEIENFAKDIKNILQDKSDIFAYRIKEPFSALRTYRLANYNKADKLHDLLGFLIVVENEDEIKNIEKILKDNLNADEVKTYNLLIEKEFKAKKYDKFEDDIKTSQYNELIFKDINTWLKIPDNLQTLLPPFSYNLLCEKKFKDIKDKVKIEIRIQTKEDFITTESYYYTIHKNDNIKLNVKIPLLCMYFRILRRMSNIAFESDVNIIKKYKTEIKEMQSINKDFIEENRDEIENVIRENNRIIKCYKDRLPIYKFNRN